LIQLKKKIMEVVYKQEGDPEPDTRLEMMIKGVAIYDGVPLQILASLCG
jgi:hypothetical protein